MDKLKLSGPIQIKLFQDDLDKLREIKEDSGFTLTALIRSYVRDRLRQMEEGEAT